MTKEHSRELNFRKIMIGWSIVSFVIFSIASLVGGTLFESSFKGKTDVEKALIYVGFSAGYATIYLGAMYALIERRLEFLQETFKVSGELCCECLPPTTKSISDTTIEKLAYRVSRRVLLMYLGEREPDLQYREQVKRILQSLKRQRELECNHLVLATPMSIEWIESQIKSMKDVPNFNLSCFIDSGDLSIHRLAISVQVFDFDQVVLVDPGKSKGTTTNERDILCRSKAVATMFASYYDGVWNKAMPLIVRGDLHQGNYSKLQQTLGRQVGGKSN